MIWGCYIRDRYFCCVAADAELAQLAIWRQLRACDWSVPIAEIRPFPATPPAIVWLVQRSHGRSQRRRAAA